MTEGRGGAERRGAERRGAGREGAGVSLNGQCSTQTVRPASQPAGLDWTGLDWSVLLTA